MRRVAIVGGGFTGAAVAVRLSRAATQPLDIAIIEPRRKLGGGLAYDNSDPDHRVNGSAELLVLFPDDFRAFARWFTQSGGYARDPEALWPASGVTYVRRSEVARWMQELLEAEMTRKDSSTRIRHLRNRATHIDRARAGWRLQLDAGTALDAETVILALAGQAPDLPRGVLPETAALPGFVCDPFNSAELSRVPAKGSVLLIGSGLTSADVVATLHRQGHRGTITVVSRRGLRPSPAGEAPDVGALIARLAQPVPRFLRRHGQDLGLMAAFRALRADIAAAAAAGRDLKQPFDDARDAASRLWPSFTNAEKARFLRHLKPWYDTLRYRMVPQTGAVLAQLEATGRLDARAARLLSVAPVAEGRFEVRLRPRGGPEETLSFDMVINCTGPKSFGADPFFGSLLSGGHACADRFGLGLEVDDMGRVICAQGRAQGDLRAYGLICRAHFGDMTAIPQIAFHLHRSLADLTAAAQGTSQPSAEAAQT